jgi:hypothetical protein
MELEDAGTRLDRARFAIVGPLIVLGRPIEGIFEATWLVATAWASVVLPTSATAATSTTAAASTTTTANWTAASTRTTLAFLSHVSPSKRELARSTMYARDLSVKKSGSA